MIEMGRRGLSTLLVMSVLGGVAWSQTENETRPDEAARKRAEKLNRAVQDLDEIVVTPGRIEETIFDTPSSVVRLNAEELFTERVPSTLPDALREVPGVMIQKTGPGLGAPYIRGLTGFRTLMLVDGVRVNHPAMRSGPNQYFATVDPLSLGRIEVEKGPASVLYGSDAAGGTIQAFSRTLDLGSEGEGWEFGGEAYYRFNSAEASNVTHESFRGGYDGRFGFEIGGSYKDFGNTDAGGKLGRQKGLEYDAYSVDAKLTAIVDENLELEFLFQRVRLNDVPRHHSTANGINFHGTTHGSDRKRAFDQTRDLALLTARITDGSFFDEAVFKVSYQAQDEVQDRIRSSGRRDKSGFDVDTLGVLGQLTSETQIGTLVYGFDLYVDWVDSFKTRLNTDGSFQVFPQGPVGDDSRYLSLGVYVQDTLSLGDWGELQAGVRFNYVDVVSDEVIDPASGGVGSLDANYEALAGSLKLLVHATENVNVYAGASSGFRAPNLSDLTRFDAARSGEFEIPSPNLDPEYFVGLEFGAKAQWENFRGEASYFYTVLIDTIIRSPTGVVNGSGESEVTKSNVGDGHLQGVELALAWDVLEDVTLSGNFAWVDGLVDTFPTSAPVVESEPPSRLPPIHALVGVDWRPSFFEGFWARFDAEIVGRADRLSPRDRADTQRIPPGGTPGYTIYNLRFAYDVNENLKVFLHLENLTDKNYRIHGSGSNEAGFSAVAGFHLRF